MTWREQKADGYDAEVAAIERALAELAEVHELFEARRDAAACGEVRAVVSMLRGRASTIASEASALRTTPPADGFPMTFTTRRARRRREPELELEAPDPRDADEVHVGLGELDGGGE